MERKEIEKITTEMVREMDEVFSAYDTELKDILSITIRESIGGGNVGNVKEVTDAIEKAYYFNRLLMDRASLEELQGFLHKDYDGDYENFYGLNDSD